MKVRQNQSETTVILHREDEDREQVARRLHDEIMGLSWDGGLRIEFIYDPNDNNRVVDFVVIPMTGPLAKQQKGRA